MSNLSRKKRKKLRQDGIIDINSQINLNRFNVSDYVSPKSEGQKTALHEWEKGQDLLLMGTPGTGKTFIGLYCAIKEVLNPKTPYSKIHIIRSAVDIRKQGFVPGTQPEKDAEYAEAYPPIVNEILGRGDAYSYMQKLGYIHFRTTTRMRSITLDDCIIIVDEVQNMNDAEINTVYTRQGKDSRIVFIGDTKQCDITGPYDKSGLSNFIKVSNEMEETSQVIFTPDDILRSDKIRSYILARERLGL